jgi:uncharacterized oligopeptide transporter (OPT) family protein
MGIGMLIPAYYVFPMVIGALVRAVWHRANPKQEEGLSTPLASGFIVGEALLSSLVIPLLSFFLMKKFGISLGSSGRGH